MTVPLSLPKIQCCLRSLIVEHFFSKDSERILNIGSEVNGPLGFLLRNECGVDNLSHRCFPF